MISESQTEKGMKSFSCYQFKCAIILVLWLKLYYFQPTSYLLSLLDIYKFVIRILIVFGS